MTVLGTDVWPVTPIKTERLVLRASEARDRAVVIELDASPEVGTYLGGPRPRAELERLVPEVPGRRPGFFVVELDGAAIGTIQLDPHSPEDAAGRRAGGGSRAGGGGGGGGRGAGAAGEAGAAAGARVSRGGP
ncbi:GNAT family N-acetyltransferase, partial [Streptomyces sp. NPDC059627]